MKTPIAKAKKIIVVLGMHRSGTSAFTCGLQLLGIDLGNTLMPAVQGVNDKGFYEDTEINALNEELLAALDLQWHSLSPISTDMLCQPNHEALRERACALIREKLRGTDAFAVKDPRMCRLLPFWKEVFSACDVDLSYVLVSRNPLSISKSLERVHQLPAEKGFYLWLEHIIPSVLETCGRPRVLVDYDHLMDNPELELTKVNNALGLKVKMDKKRLMAFLNEFLELSLRHTKFSLDDVLSSNSVPGPVKIAAGLLADIADERLSLDAPEVVTGFEQISEQMEAMTQCLVYIQRLDCIVEDFRRQVREQTLKFESLHSLFKEKENNIDGLHTVIAKRDAEIVSLSTVNKGQSQRNTSLEQKLVERDAEIASLSVVNSEQSQRNDVLEQKLSVRDAKILKLEFELSEKKLEVQHYSVAAVQFSYRLDSARSAPGWKIRKVLRRWKRFLSRKKSREQLSLLAFHQLQADNGGWVASGNDPQFLMISERAWHGLGGWHWLEFDVYSEQPLNAEIYFDVGAGFDDSRIIHFALSGDGRQRVPLYIPVNCQSIRFDPCDHPAVIASLGIWLDKMATPPQLPSEFLSQTAQYEALGAREGNILAINPVHQITRHKGNDFCWSSSGDDPYFLIDGLRQPLQPGWCRFDLRIRADHDNGFAKFYLDYGGDFNEKDVLQLSFVSGQTTVRFAFLKKELRRVRLDPFDCPANFSIEKLSVMNVTADESRVAMLQRIADASEKYRGKTTEYVWDTLQALTVPFGNDADEQLYQLYIETFPTSKMRDTVTYNDWIYRNETSVSNDLHAIGTVQKSFNFRPLISIIMPVYNTPEKYLRKALHSVLRQSYEHWELCIADDASTESHIRPLLEEYVRLDSRIKLIIRSENGHISIASNSALSLATGDFVALFDHDDELAEHALHFMVAEINLNPKVKLLYSDEDKIDAEGHRFEPHFKPDWSPDLLFSQNYISHLGLYRRDLLQSVGGFRKGVEGSQDYDLLLRCLLLVTGEEIVHVPKILYHWRALDGSTALNATQKNYTSRAGVKALCNYFRQQGQTDIQIDTGMVPNTYHIRYPLPKKKPLVSLMIPTRDGLEFLEPCVRSILEKTTYRNYEIIILNNQSRFQETNDFFDRIQEEHAAVRVLSYDNNFNFSAINNFGVEHANGDLIGLINNDIEIISPEWLDEMLRHALRPEIGCVGAKLLYSDDTIQHAGIILGIGGVAGHSHKYFHVSEHGYFSRLKIVQNVSAVTAACLLVRREIYNKVGGMDDKNLSVAFNDVDFCLKVREAGYLNLWTPYATLYHYESKSRGQEDSPEKIERFRKEVEFMTSKWGDVLKKDPYYNINLTLDFEDFSLSK